MGSFRSYCTSYQVIRSLQPSNVRFGTLHHKAFFFMAITSGRRVSEAQALGASESHIVFFLDRVELRPVDHSVPKVVTFFHQTGIWALPNFPEEHSGKIHELDVSRMLKKYLSATAPFRSADKLFINPVGKQR